jgi:hypothetical protein
MKRMKDYDGMQVVMSRGNLHKTKQSAERLFSSLLSLLVLARQTYTYHSNAGASFSRIVAFL